MFGDQPELFPMSDIEVIAAFLTSKDAPEDCVSVSELDGLLTAVAIGPEFVPPSEWLPVVWGEESPAFESLEQAERVLGAIMARYNEIIHSLNDEPPTFAPILWEAKNGAVFAGDWAIGFMVGVGLRAKAWSPFLRSRRHADIMAPIFALLPEAQDVLGDMPIAELGELLNDAAEFIPDCVSYAHAHWKRKRAGLAGAVSNHEFPFRVKVGRNELCPCGSNKKFKKCCGGVAVAA